MKTAFGLMAAVGVAAMMIASPVAAAGMSMPSPDEAMTTDWTGFYVGGGFSSMWFDGPSFPGPEYSFDLLVGADYQMGQFVLGARGDLAWEWSPYFGGINNGYPRVGGEVRGGVAVGDSVLLYGTVGVEYYPWNGPNPWYYGTFGIGAEYKVTDTLSVDLEAKRFIGLAAAHNWVGDQIRSSLVWHIK